VFGSLAIPPEMRHMAVMKRKLLGLELAILLGVRPIVALSCFSACSALSMVVFAPSSQLRRIESNAFSHSSLRTITIPRTVEVLCSSCFASCASLLSVFFESGSRALRFEERAFTGSRNQSITVPRSVEVLCVACFSFCYSLSCISFESNSSLKWIENESFASSGLRSIGIPARVEFLESSAFKGVYACSVSVESGHPFLRMDDLFLVDFVRHRFVRNFDTSLDVVVPPWIEFLCADCFSFCVSCCALSSILFGSNSFLKEIGANAFSNCSVQRVAFPRSLEILGESSFSNCLSLVSVSFGPAVNCTESKQMPF
jgi:hypothetical protein